MLWRASDVPGIGDGSITVAFRRWVRPQVVAGRPHRTPAGRIEVEAVDVVAPEDVTDDDARAAGHAHAAALLAAFGDGPPLHRIRFHRLDEPDPRDVLADDDDLDEAAVAAIRARLDRLDRAAVTGAGGDGPWTAATLAAIAERPGVRAGDLAADLGRDRLAFKADVRKLKALGLTRSLPVGYQLSRRGAAYLARATGAAPSARRRPAPVPATGRGGPTSAPSRGPGAGSA